MFQYNACIFHSLIKQIRKGVAIVSVQCIYTYILVNEGVATVSVHACTFYLLIKQIWEGVAIVSVQCIKLQLLIKQIREGVAILFSTVHQTQLNN